MESTTPGNGSPPPPLSREVARHILDRMGQNGTPPERGISFVNVGNETYLQLLDKEYLEELIQGAGGSSFKLVQGSFGTGKTHFLHCLRDYAWQRRFLISLITLSPKECPFHKPLRVYQAVANNLLHPPASDNEEPVRGLPDILRSLAEERIRVVGRDDFRDWVENTLGRAPIDRTSFRRALVQFLLALTDEVREETALLEAWLLGQDVTLGDARSVNVYEVPSDQNGFAMLRSLVQAVVHLGFSGNLLLFDEAERRLSIELKQARATKETVDHLRELVDLCGRSDLPKTLIVYAVTPTFTQNILPEYPALQQRLGYPVQYMKPHNPRAPLIDLEDLDLDPLKLLTSIGEKLESVARIAYDWSLDPSIAQANLSLLAQKVTEEHFEVSHRRQFVKLWIRLLDDLRLRGARKLSSKDIEMMVRDEFARSAAEAPAFEDA